MTVKQVAELAGITIKTLHHYDNIGVLKPKSRSESGNRLYNSDQLKQLQQILFYKELDFSLKQIKILLSKSRSREDILFEQKELLNQRKIRLKTIMHTLDEALYSEKSGTELEEERMFEGLTKEEWVKEFREYSNYFEENYQFSPFEFQFTPEESYKLAKKTTDWINKMENALISGLPPYDSKVCKWIADHISYINQEVRSIDVEGFVRLVSFFIEDEFHRQLFEKSQTGLLYYMYTSAVYYAQAANENT